MAAAVATKGANQVQATNQAAALALGPSRRKLPPADPFASPAVLESIVKQVRAKMLEVGQLKKDDEYTLDWASTKVASFLPPFVKEALTSGDDTRIARATAALNAAAYQLRGKEQLGASNEAAKAASAESRPKNLDKASARQDRFSPTQANGETPPQPVDTSLVDHLSPSVARLVEEKREQLTRRPPLAPRGDQSTAPLVMEDSSIARDAAVLSMDDILGIRPTSAPVEAAPKAGEWISKPPELLPPPVTQQSTTTTTVIEASLVVVPLSPDVAPVAVAANDDKPEQKDVKQQPPQDAEMAEMEEEPPQVQQKPADEAIADAPAAAEEEKGGDDGEEDEEEHTDGDEEEEEEVAAESNAEIEEGEDIGDEDSELDAKEEGPEEEENEQDRAYFEAAEKQSKLDALAEKERLEKKKKKRGLTGEESPSEDSELSEEEIAKDLVTLKRSSRSARGVTLRKIQRVASSAKHKQLEEEEEKNDKEDYVPSEEDDDDDDDDGSAESVSAEEENESVEAEEEEAAPPPKKKPAAAAPAKELSPPAKKKPATETDRVQQAAVEVFGDKIKRVAQEADAVARTEPKRKAETTVTAAAPPAKKKATEEPKAAAAAAPPQKKHDDSELRQSVKTALSLFVNHELCPEGKRSRLITIATSPLNELSEEDMRDRLAYWQCFYREKDDSKRATKGNNLDKLAHAALARVAQSKHRNLALLDLLTVAIGADADLDARSLADSLSEETLEYMRRANQLNSPLPATGPVTDLIILSGSHPLNEKGKQKWSTSVFAPRLSADYVAAVYFGAHVVKQASESLNTFLKLQGLEPGTKAPEQAKPFLESVHANTFIEIWLQTHRTLERCIARYNE